MKSCHLQQHSWKILGGYYVKRNKSEGERYYMISLIYGIWKKPQTNKWKKIINAENKLVVTKEAEGWRVSKTGEGWIMFFFLTEKFLSAPGLSSYLFSVMVQPLPLVISQSFLHLIPHWAMIFLRARLYLLDFFFLQLLTLGSSDIYLGYTSWFKKCLSNDWVNMKKVDDQGRWLFVMMFPNLNCK